MSDAKKNFFDSLIWNLVRGATVIQCVFAVIWLFKNLFVFHSDFYANAYSIALQSLVVDDYLGILYALLARLFGTRWCLYIVQMAAVYVSARLLTNSRFAALFVFTNPLILESTVMVRPEAFLISAIMTLIWAVGKLFSTGAYRYLGETLGLILFMSLLQPDYAFLCAVAGVPAAIYFMVKKKNGSVLFLLGIVVIFFLSTAVNNRISKPEAFGGVEKTVSFLKMQRTIQKDTFQYVEIFNEYYGADISEASEMADLIPECVNYSFARALYDEAGEENARAFMDYMTDVSVSRGFGFWLKPIIKDLAYYFFTPASVMYAYKTLQTDTNLFGPIGIFTAQLPKLSYFYLWFGLCVAIAVSALGVFRLFKQKTWFIFIYISAWLALYATLICSRGFDFRNALFITIAWPLAALSMYERN